MPGDGRSTSRGRGQPPPLRALPPGPPSPAARYDDRWRAVYGDLQGHGPVHRHMRRLLAGLLDSLDYDTALEVGCGAGHNLALLARRPGVRLTGADISQEALARAARHGDAELITLDIERTALARSWDLVFSSLVLEHLEDDAAALAHMRSMTRRHLVISTMAGDYERHRPWEEQVGHVRNYRRGELESALERCGFEVRRSIYWGFPLYSPLVRRLQNHWRAEPSFGPATRAAAAVLHALYHLNSSRRGDLLIVHATVPGGG